MDMSRLCVPYTPFAGDLKSSRICLVSTAGVHLKTDKPFDLEGDTTFRVIPAEASPKDLMVTHAHYDHSDADADINCVFPIERLSQMAKRGKIGSLTKRHFSMGYSQALKEIREVTVPAVVAEVIKEKADMAVLTGG